jgi:hypothetical protein
MFAGSAVQWLKRGAGEGGLSRRHCIAACLLAAIGLAACAVGPDFKRPAIAAPAAYRVPEESSASADGVAPSASESAASAHFWNPLTAAGRAALDGVVTQQAQIIAYLDDY